MTLLSAITHALLLLALMPSGFEALAAPTPALPMPAPAMGVTAGEAVSPAYLVALPMVLVPERYPADNRAFELELLRLINDTRTAHGLPVLREHPALTQAARRHARDMVNHQFASHTGSDGSSHHDRMVQEGYAGTPWAEAAGLGNPDPQAQLAGWLASPLHRQIVLDATATEIGLGYAASPLALYPHAWTIDLGVGTGNALP